MMMQRFGEKLRFLRKRAGKTQRDLADELGFAAHSYVHALETGKKKPSADLVFKVARLFNVSADRLLDDVLEVEEAPE
jgi:transcriptional regulator with XRE-family HTH domain